MVTEYDVTFSGSINDQGLIVWHASCTLTGVGWGTESATGWDLETAQMIQQMGGMYVVSGSGLTLDEASRRLASEVYLISSTYGLGG